LLYFNLEESAINLSVLLLSNTDLLHYLNNTDLTINS